MVTRSSEAATPKVYPPSTATATATAAAAAAAVVAAQPRDVRDAAGRTSLEESLCRQSSPRGGRSKGRSEGAGNADSLSLDSRDRVGCALGSGDSGDRSLANRRQLSTTHPISDGGSDPDDASDMRGGSDDEDGSDAVYHEAVAPLYAGASPNIAFSSVGSSTSYSAP